MRICDWFQRREETGQELASSTMQRGQGIILLQRGKRSRWLKEENWKITHSIGLDAVQGGKVNRK